MHSVKLFILITGIQLFVLQPINPVTSEPLRNFFMFKTSAYGQKSNIVISLNEHLFPSRYEANLNMPVCDDNLCANLVLKVYWDLAGNYAGFDTINGKPLTKFDHHPFTSTDYKKLDEILWDKNSILRVLEKEELTDKSVKLKSSTVDAVTGATPTSVKEQVVEGAVYSVYTLWHFVNGAVNDSIKQYSRSLFSDKLGEQMLRSTNHETQLFALKQMQNSFYETNTTIIFEVITKSSPLVRAFIINKMPIPFSNMDKNRAFASLYINLDSYSKSVFCERIISTKVAAEIFIPLMNNIYQKRDEKLAEKMQQAAIQYSIQ